MWKEDAAHCVNEQYADEFNQSLLRVIEKAEAKPQPEQPLRHSAPGTHPYFLILSLLLAYWITRRTFSRWSNVTNITAAALAGIIVKRYI
mmetsp:Transcript_18319/g.22454  ORF Transcript_18319/g.22454 Transcript_18319/m.22454 type:complete len:90 (-) Transcript_18319:1110-1379(-)